MELEEFNRKILPIKDKLYRFALTMLQNREEAKDALQEVFLKLWTHRERLDIVENHESYAMKMIKNFCLDKLKFFKGKQMVDISDRQMEVDNFTPFTTVSFNNLRDLMVKLFSSLPEQQRIVIHMRDIEHCTFEEIQEVTGMTINNIRVNLSRARQSVKVNYMKIKSYENR
jgi:RNA polymerase sigma factor (sigma-70 family)